MINQGVVARQEVMQLSGGLGIKDTWEQPGFCFELNIESWTNTIRNTLAVTLQKTMQTDGKS